VTSVTSSHNGFKFTMDRTRETSYERLPQGEEAEGSRSQRPLSFVRPPIYYGDGPFDPPSSDSDDEGDEGLSFIEKNRPSSPGRAEAGADSGSGWIPSTDDKVRAIVCSISLSPGQGITLYRTRNNSSLPSLHYSEIFLTLPCSLACCTHWICCVDWNNSCFNIYQLFDISTNRLPKNDNGPCLQWDVLRTL
jgi:hypothetical protein